MALIIVKGNPLRTTVAIKPSNQPEVVSEPEAELLNQPHAWAVESVNRADDAADWDDDLTVLVAESGAGPG